MLKSDDSFVPTNREPIDNHVNNIKEMEKTLKLIETRMEKYHIEPFLSLTSLPKSPRHYWRPSKMKRPFLVSPKTLFNGAFIKSILPLEDKDENRAIATSLYKEEVPVDLTDQSHEITPEKYGLGLKLIKCLGYKSNGPIGHNNNRLIDPIKETSRKPCDTIGLGFKKVPFHLGINKFVPKSDSSSKHESQTESDNQA